MKVERVEAYELRMPQLFSHPEFLAFLNSTATSWPDKGEVPGDISDVFTIYDDGEGVDRAQMGEHCWELIVSTLRAAVPNPGYCLLRIKNEAP